MIIGDEQEILSYLDGFANYERQPPAHYSSKTYNLRRMVLWASALGNPHQRYRSIHVAGSKGKGSTSAMMARVLQEAGVRVGLYTSPHLMDFRERIKVDGRDIPRDTFCDLVSELKPVLEDFRDCGITYFEVITGLALEYFARAGVEVAVLEVGLGGRLDATNVVRPVCSCITTLDLEHTDRLGPTIQDIAREKAGIIKRQIPCVTTVTDPQALSVLDRIARQRRSSLIRMGQEFVVSPEGEDPHRSDVSIRGIEKGYAEVSVGLEGWHQRVNAAGVVVLSEMLCRSGIQVPESAVRQGLQSVQWPGRMQRLGGDPRILLDCAHSRRSMEALLDALRGEDRMSEAVVLIGVLKDKDIDSLVDILTSDFRRFVVTTPSSPRAKDPGEIAEMIRQRGRDVCVERRVGPAFDLAQKLAGAGGQVLVTGSVYLVGEVLQIAPGS